MTKLEQLAQWITREDLIDGTDNAGLLRAAQAVVDAAGVYVSHQDAACHQSCASWRGVDEDCHCGYVDLCEAIYSLQKQPT